MKKWKILFLAVVAILMIFAIVSNVPAEEVNACMNPWCGM